MPCRYHGGHVCFSVYFDRDNFKKNEFDDWQQTLSAQSVSGKIANLENQPEISLRPWDSFYTLVSEVTTRSETKMDFEQIGISLHKVTSKNSYSLQFVCKGCNKATNAMFPLHDAVHHRHEVDGAMLHIFVPYFNTNTARPYKKMGGVEQIEPSTSTATSTATSRHWQSGLVDGNRMALHRELSTATAITLD